MLWAIVAMSIDDPRGRPAPLEAARRLVPALPARGARRRRDKPRSWVLDLMRRSPLMRRLRRLRRRPAGRRAAAAPSGAPPARPRRRDRSDGGRRGRACGSALVWRGRRPPRSRGAAGAPPGSFTSPRRSAPGVGIARRGPRRDLPPHGRRARPRRALDRARRDPDRPLAEVVAPPAARRPARRVVSGADDLSARHRGDARPARSPSP